MHSCSQTEGSCKGNGCRRGWVIMVKFVSFTHFLTQELKKEGKEKIIGKESRKECGENKYSMNLLNGKG